jgi:AcrR family transcriptional regulator
MTDDTNTEFKIKQAAQRVFLKKGYAATRTRDIAEEAGFNPALLNYYFRSKEKLFEIVMLENLQLFVSGVFGILTDESTTLREKLHVLVGHYIDMLQANPDLPAFIIGEIRDDPDRLMAQLGFSKLPPEASILRQWQALAGAGAVVRPTHIMMNLIAMVVFPFAAAPLIRSRTGMDRTAFSALMDERKKLIPMWIEQMIMSGATANPEKPTSK